MNSTTTVEEIRTRYEGLTNNKTARTVVQMLRDIRKLIAEVDRLEEQINEITNCDKCDLCEDHHRGRE